MTVMESSFSPDAIARKFEIIETFNVLGIAAAVVFDPSVPRAAVIELATTPNERSGPRHRVLGFLELAKKHRTGDNEICSNAIEIGRYWQDDDYLAQVEGVCVLPELRESQIATRLYEALILKRGITLISDIDQYQGGKSIWVKLARDDNGVAVYVFDSESNRFYPYDGDRIEYNGVNIPDDQIWSTHPDKSKWPVVLVAEKQPAE